jgi:hypothetical protein
MEKIVGVQGGFFYQGRVILVEYDEGSHFDDLSLWNRPGGKDTAAMDGAIIDKQVVRLPRYKSGVFHAAKLLVLFINLPIWPTL